MGKSPHQPERPIRGLTYFDDFIKILERRYAYASVAAVREDIDFARTVGPVLAGLIELEKGVFLVRTAIGRGDHAVVELEFDRNGILEPVMGGFERNPKHGKQSEPD